ncbi:coiled-coil domain-containing protein 34 [Zootermopsis nevadensis]|uniref:Coiled-coil domain-containing protein n=1 Tax=Zootermopsis nevadensis TaxID=136037 RepID=A0A067QHR9_ZOONE|nr:coiled-coil domain-containing protein 34 [Zootermopsis nevadensis]XP_021940113.1 coiled-coil domain-containing protein 34 [Zootermopsis nevadensis]XP_021940114.1 coiled-coil domain-containing protein 34 [Zootermopsis nevadensis]XP_021940115.1 coiled-coil domain-containing protein 34 [Zootermopsis nevadensis]KDR07940.1 hypothetical protein L798_01594 [Zootermopsis nevadensis]
MMDDYTNVKSSVSGITRTHTTKLVDASYSGSFPEKHICRKIISAVPGKGDLHCLHLEDKCLLTENKDSLISNKDSAWRQWYMSKLEQKREAKKNEEIKKMAEEERQKEQRLRKQELEDRYIRIWKEKKGKEDAARRREDKAKQMDVKKILKNEKQKKEQDQEMAERSHAEWVKRKNKEQKEQKLREVRLQQEREEEKRLRAERSITAFEQWKETAKTRPKPMSVAIRDHKGQSDPSLARLNWNPIPWQNIIEEPKTYVVEDPGRKKLVKPCCM